MWYGCGVFDQFYFQTCCFQRRDGAFPSRSGPIHPNLHIFYTKLRCFFSRLLSSALPCKWRTLTTSLETTGTSTGPTKRVTPCVRDGYCCIVESCPNMGDSGSDVTSNFSFLSLGHLVSSPECFASCQKRITDRSTYLWRLSHILHALLSCNRLARAFSRTRIRSSLLTSYRKTATVTHPAVTSNVSQTG